MSERPPLVRPVNKPIVNSPLTVTTSEDCGGYFCEHAFFVGGAAARLRGVRLGFLHVPSDDETFDVAETDRLNLARQAENRVVIGAFLRGLIDEDAAGDELRVLLTGFGPFKIVVDNPSGAFVNDLENLSILVLETCPGAQFLGVDGEFPLREGTRARIAFLLPDGRRLVLCVAHMPVDERVLNDVSGTAIADLIAWSDAKTVLLVGVASFDKNVWRVETVVSDRGLRLTDGTFVHEKGRAPTVQLQAGGFVATLLANGMRAQFPDADIAPTVW